MNNKDISNEWFIFAENDLKSAEFLLNMKTLPLERISKILQLEMC